MTKTMMILMKKRGKTLILFFNINIYYFFIILKKREKLSQISNSGSVSSSGSFIDFVFEMIVVKFEMTLQL